MKNNYPIDTKLGYQRLNCENKFEGVVLEVTENSYIIQPTKGHSCDGLHFLTFTDKNIKVRKIK
jgi:hypothetical protein